MNIKPTLTLIILTAALCVGPTASAQTTSIWSGAVDNDWNTAGNWDNGVPDGNFVATFNTAGAKTINISSPVSLRQIVLVAGQTEGVSLSGGLLTFDILGSSNNLQGIFGVTLTIDNYIHFSRQFNINAGSLTVLNGNITSSGTVVLRKINSEELHLNGDNSGMVGTNTWSGVPGTSVALEAGNIVVGTDTALGAGRVTFSGANNKGIVASGRTIPNGIHFASSGGLSRLQAARGTTATFSTSDIGGSHGITLIQSGGTNGDATIRFTGDALNVSNAVTVSNTTTVLEFANTNGTQAWNGVIAGGGRVVKSGAGTTTLAGTNTYTNTTTVVGGTFVVNGSNTGAGAVTVATNAVLGGGGSIAGALTLDGSLRPGSDDSSIGTLAAGGNVTWNGTAGNAWGFHLGSTNTSDRVAISGNFIKGTGSEFRFDFLGTGQAGTYTLATFAQNGNNTPETTFTDSDFSATNLATGVSGYFLITGTDLFFIATAAPTSELVQFRADNGLNPDGSQDLDEPAGDGVPNLLKFAFNMIGNGAGQAPNLDTPNVAVIAPDGSAGLPRVGTDAGKLTITYLRRKASGDPGISYTVQFASNLATGPWAVNESATEDITDIDATFERVTVTDSLVSPGQRFARVLITEL